MLFRKSAFIQNAWLLLAAVPLFLLANPIPTYAHSEVVDSNPLANSVVDQLPEVVTVRFSSKILTIGSEEGANQLIVSDASGNRIDSGNSSISGDSISTSINQTSPEGDYLVAFRIVSQDGHPIEGSFSFTYGSGPETKLSTSAEPAASEQNTNDWTQILIVIVLAGLTVTGLFTLRKKAKK